MAALDLVLAKPVIENLKKLLAFLSNQFVERGEILRSKAFHSDRVSFETAFPLLPLLQVEVHRVDEVTNDRAETLKPDRVERRRKISSIQKSYIAVIRFKSGIGTNQFLKQCTRGHPGRVPGDEFLERNEIAGKRNFERKPVRTEVLGVLAPALKYSRNSVKSDLGLGVRVSLTNAMDVSRGNSRKNSDSRIRLRAVLGHQLSRCDVDIGTPDRVCEFAVRDAVPQENPDQRIHQVTACSK